MKQEIVHVALVVRDYDEAIELFAKKLDFRLVEDMYQPAQDKRWVGDVERHARQTKSIV